MAIFGINSLDFWNVLRGGSSWLTQEVVLDLNFPAAGRLVLGIPRPLS